MAPRGKARPKRRVARRLRKASMKPRAVRGKPARRRAEEALAQEWLHRFLGNLAAIEADTLGPRGRRPSIRFQKLRRAHQPTTQRRFRSPTPYSWDRLSAESADVALHRPNDSVGNAGAEEPSRTRDERRLLEKMDRYMAGIDEASVASAAGKRRARGWLRKALAFGLRTGYLLPGDQEGRLLRVAPTLVAAAGPRRRARSGRKRRSARRPRRRRARSARPSRRRARNASPAQMEDEERDDLGIPTPDAQDDNGQTSSEPRSDAPEPKRPSPGRDSASPGRAEIEELGFEFDCARPADPSPTGEPLMDEPEERQ